jgi:hypothetical protein
MAGSPVEAMTEALTGGAPEAPAVAGTPATVEGQMPFIEAQLGTTEQPTRYGPTKFSEIAKQASDSRKMPEEEKQLSGEEQPQEEQPQEQPEEQAGEEPELFPLEHPVYGVIYLTKEQINRMAAGALAPQQQQQTPDRRQSGFQNERASIENEMRLIKADENLTDDQKAIQLMRLELKLSRVDNSESRYIMEQREFERDLDSKTASNKAEANDAMKQNPDVFDVDKVLPDMPFKAREKFVMTALTRFTDMLESRRYDHLKPVELVSIVAKEMREWASTLGLSRREVIKSYVQHKRVGTAPGAAPSTKGGGRAPDQGSTPDLRSGLGRAMLSRALEGRTD